jgi:lipid-A-disaccharide synthase-like uncharacterized protein
VTARSPAAVLTIAAALLISIPSVGSEPPSDSNDTVELRLKPLPDGVKKMRIEAAPDGSHRVVVTTVDGREQRLRPDEFIDWIDRDTRQRRFLYRLLNITSPIGIAWVLVGLLGQVAFAGRMVFQWLVSEKRKRSVVPVGFWWMSLIGATMMLIYFVWRRDIVGVLGQTTGWMIYLRNLWLIHREARSE